MKATIEELIFPESIKIKLKMKVSQDNLKVEYISGYLIKFNKTSLSIMESHKIIIYNNKATLIGVNDTIRMYEKRKIMMYEFLKNEC